MKSSIILFALGENRRLAFLPYDQQQGSVRNGAASAQDERNSPLSWLNLVTILVSDPRFATLNFYPTDVSDRITRWPAFRECLFDGGNSAGSIHLPFMTIGTNKLLIFPLLLLCHYASLVHWPKRRGTAEKATLGFTHSCTFRLQTIQVKSI